MEKYIHKITREIDIEKYITTYFSSNEEGLNKTEAHFFNLLKLAFVYEVESNKDKGNFSSSIFNVIQKYRVYFNDDFKIENNKFYLATNTEIKKFIENKYNFKLVLNDAVMKNHVYGGEQHKYQLIKIHNHKR